MAENRTEHTGVIYGINGPIVHLKKDAGFMMNEMVYVGRERLVGEVIGLSTERTTIQVYEETTGIRPGEVVYGTGAPVSVTLAPGILTNIFDGIERPLSDRQDRGRLHQPWRQCGISGHWQKMADSYDCQKR